MNFRVTPIPGSVADHVRTLMSSPGYGHPAHREVARGTGPCRSCLAPFQVGVDERILFTWQPFQGDALPSPGPIFIHAHECERFEGAGMPPGLGEIPLVVEAFDAKGQSLGRQAVGAGDLESMMGEWVNATGADYLHLRHAVAGCFIARIQIDH
jgi:hypothetical protein